MHGAFSSHCHAPETHGEVPVSRSAKKNDPMSVESRRSSASYMHS
jgi:hypothetical protein